METRALSVSSGQLRRGKKKRGTNNILFQFNFRPSSGVHAISFKPPTAFKERLDKIRNLEILAGVIDGIHKALQF